jgi:hypothetical protein
VNLDNIKSFIYPTDAQIDCSKEMLKFTLKFTCFVSLQPSSGSYYMCFAKRRILNNY